MVKSVRIPRNLMPSALRSSVSAMEMWRQGTKQLLRPQDISLSDMGDTLRVFFASTHRSHLYSSPGRFFAINELKALLAHIIVTYDIIFEGGKQAPCGLIINSVRIPGKANAMFRKCQKCNVIEDHIFQYMTTRLHFLHIYLICSHHRICNVKKDGVCQ